MFAFTSKFTQPFWPPSIFNSRSSRYAYVERQSVKGQNFLADLQNYARMVQCNVKTNMNSVTKSDDYN